MSIRKPTGISIPKARRGRDFVAGVDFTLHTSLHENYVDEDFVHSIVGRIVVEPENGEEKEVGCIRASLVRFGDALDHGVSSTRLGDGISGDSSEFWEFLFDMETGYLKEGILDEYEVVGLDLLIIDWLESIRHLGVRESVGRPLIGR